MVLSTSNPPSFHSPLGDVNIEEGLRFPCVLAPEVLMNRNADYMMGVSFSGICA